MNVYIQENSVIAKIAAIVLKEKKMAVTIGRTIYLYNCCAGIFLKNKTWVCHELVHVYQYKKYGRLMFIIYYLSQSLINGYTNNRFEREACLKEHDLSLLNNIQFTVL